VASTFAYRVSKSGRGPIGRLSLRAAIAPAGSLAIRCLSCWISSTEQLRNDARILGTAQRVPVEVELSLGSTQASHVHGTTEQYRVFMVRLQSGPVT
jgi:hypothetical protein